MMITLNKYNKYHLDWKEDNTLKFYNDIYNFNKLYKLKLTDFGYAKYNWKTIKGLTI